MVKKAVKIILLLLLARTSVFYSMDIQPFVFWNSLPYDLKLGVVAMSTLQDRQQLRFVNKELSLISCKKNIGKMLQFSPCSRKDHIRSMISASTIIPHDVDMMKGLMAAAPYCNHDDFLDVLPFFTPYCTDEQLSQKLNDCNDHRRSKALTCLLPIIMQVYGGSKECVPRCLTKYGQTGDKAICLQIAIFDKNLPVVELMCLQNPQLAVGCEDDVTPLQYSITSKEVNIMKVLLNNGALVDKTSNISYLTLLLAIYENNAEVLKIFFDDYPHLIDINHSNDLGITALFKAVERGYLSLVRLLLASGAQVNAKRDGMMTPLMIAASMGNIEIAKILVADPTIIINATTYQQVTALDLAKVSRQEDMVIFLNDLIAKNSGTNAHFG